MFKSFKRGDFKTYFALSRNGVHPTISQVDWAVSCKKEGQLEIIKDVLDQYPNLCFERGDCASLFMFAEKAPLYLWKKMYNLCLDHSINNAVVKSGEHVLQKGLSFSLHKALLGENLSIISYILETVLDGYDVSKTAIFRSDYISKALGKNPVCFALEFIKHGYPISRILFDDLLKVSHKDDRYVDVINELGDVAATDIMLVTIKNKKNAILMACIEEYNLVPDTSRIEDCKTIMSYYFKLKKTEPISFLETCIDKPELTAATLITLY